MGFLDRLLGREEAPQYDTHQNARAPERSADEIAVERYRYLLRTAPPETIEQVHLEAFSKLTDAQRTLLFEQLSADSSPSERPSNNSPSSLAHAATRQELLNPGSMERSLNSAGQRGGMGFGGTFASSLLGSVTGFVIGSAIASAFLPDSSNLAGSDGTADASGDSGAGVGSDDGASGDGGGDFSGGGGDFGGDFSGSGGDFGGGDFGGGFDV
ncbi:hypothetical protein [Glaciibacter sp. 2TAF33]|uniref:hypothetical protein n=1 Tax=Glaciibacter sp. 2TAF33 TaxID=3233015 RepID=UPI003F8E0D39